MTDQQQYKHLVMKARIYQKLLARDERGLKEYMESLSVEDLKVYAAALLEIAKEMT